MLPTRRKPCREHDFAEILSIFYEKFLIILRLMLKNERKWSRNMKKRILKVLVVTIIAICSFSLVACNSENDKSGGLKNDCRRADSLRRERKRKRGGKCGNSRFVDSFKRRERGRSDRAFKRRNDDYERGQLYIDGRVRGDNRERRQRRNGASVSERRDDIGRHGNRDFKHE